MANSIKKASSWAEMIKNGKLNSDFNLEYIAPLPLNKKRLIVVNEAVSKKTKIK